MKRDTTAEAFANIFMSKIEKMVLSPRAKLNRYFGRAYQRRILTDRRNRSHKEREILFSKENDEDNNKITHGTRIKSISELRPVCSKIAA